MVIRLARAGSSIDAAMKNHEAITQLNENGSNQ
jgi:hypothetical protein